MEKLTYFLWIKKRGNTTKISWFPPYETRWRHTFPVRFLTFPILGNEWVSLYLETSSNGKFPHQETWWIQIVSTKLTWWIQHVSTKETRWIHACKTTCECIFIGYACPYMQLAMHVQPITLQDIYYLLLRHWMLPAFIQIKSGIFFQEWV